MIKNLTYLADAVYSHLRSFVYQNDNDRIDHILDS
jgi:hypothetical protein